ncbi:hypothetical protein C2G38_2048232 [Gigaspora rosea]|uniref:SWIM-type domain-containing protein n=1 Tax=Gigaspora rosea TaxID=44941 RepID=A0A397U6J1_9GLOM|nr:hypothetical protein C2G38_2048232 [Gigaspora rosea]
MDVSIILIFRDGSAIIKCTFQGVPDSFFSKDMYDEALIELTELVDGIDVNDIKEIWMVSHIDQQKRHFIVLFGDAGHLCTCLTLVNRGIVCRHFFSILLESEVAWFHIGILAKRWFSDLAMQKSKKLNEHAISIRNHQEFGTFEHEIQTDFSFIDSIHGKCVFTSKIQHHVKSRALYGKGFGLMKRTLNLAIEAGCTEELYELYQQFIKRIEKQLAEQEGRIMHSENEDDYETISNPLKPRTKGRKHHKCIMAYNEGSRKKVLTESTNIQHTNNLISSNSSESIDISNVGRQVQTIQEQEREHNQDIQESDQGKCTFIY